MFENIKKLRLEHHLTQKQLADIIGVTQQCINNYENRNAYPSYDILGSLSRYFNVSMDYLCFGDSALKKPPFDLLMETYTEQDRLLHDQMFESLPVQQKRTVDILITILSDDRTA